MIGAELACPDLLSGEEIDALLPVLALECLGGPEMPTDELGQRVIDARALLWMLCQWLAYLSQDEINAAGLRLDFDDDDDEETRRDTYKQEAKRIAKAAALAFQLDEPKPWKRNKVDLYEKARQEVWRGIRNGEPIGNRWVERGPMKRLVLPTLAGWIVEYEDAYRETQLPATDTTRNQSEREEPTTHEVIPRPKSHDQDSERTEIPDSGSERPVTNAPSLTGKSPATQPPQTETRKPRTTSNGKRVIAAVAVLALLALILTLPEVQPSFFEERRRSSTSPAIAQIAGLDCAEGDTQQWGSTPTNFSDDPARVPPESVTVTVGSVNFSFESLVHRERRHGRDRWDFTFKSADAPELAFIFRSVGGDAGYGYVIDGPPGNGLEPTNLACNLIDFHKTPLGEFLENRANDEGLVWAAPSPIR
jgi:hypothetical protein